MEMTLPFHDILSAPAGGVFHCCIPSTQRVWQYHKERLDGLQMQQKLPDEETSEKKKNFFLVLKI